MAERESQGSGSNRDFQQSGRRRDGTRNQDKPSKDSSSEDKGSPGSWNDNIDRGRSRTRLTSNPASADNLRRRGYHTLCSSFGKVFHVEKRWKMVRDMGSGAYGVVISAADEISGETVAIKLITRVFDKVSLAKRALREITLLRHFASHENITGLIDVDAISKDFNEIYLFMEPMEADLHQIIKSGQTLTNEHVQYFVYQILRGMKYVHSASVVHRDLKPGNLLVNADCELKICDFGLSRGFDSRPDEHATHMTEYVATRWYRAPEIMLAFRRYNTAIDVWSIGCILAELILGKPLFKGKDYVDQLNKILDVLGTPNEGVISRIGSDKAQAYIRSLPYRKTVPFRKLIPSADPQALDLVTRMLTFDPAQRISVPEALEHPWLASYHDSNDEPDCPVSYTKWRDIEKLETIEEYREALWNEIENYRREVRSIGFDMAIAFGTAESLNAKTRGEVVSIAPATIEENIPTGSYQEKISAPAPGVILDKGDRNLGSALTTLREHTAETHPATSITNKEDAEKLNTEVESMTASQTVVPSPVPALLPKYSGTRQSLERRDSAPRSASMTNDPVITYARRSSILQAQYLQGASSSLSPVRRAVSNMPVFEDVRSSEGSLPVLTPPVAGLLSNTMTPGAVGTAIGIGSIPFPTAGGSYILPARSRTASMAGGEGLGTFGTRKLLRTLSTVSIHETVDGPGGLAAMGPMGAAIIERRETAADAPASEMPHEFHPVREEDEDGNRSGKGRESTANKTTGSKESGSKYESISCTASDFVMSCEASSKTSDKSNAVLPEPSAPPSKGKKSDSPSSLSTLTKKKEKRFIIF